MMAINYGGVYLAAVSCARQMIAHKTPGALLLIGSMSGLIANKGFTASVYNSSKAAVIQLGRSLAMEWGKVVDGKPIRVNVLCPGNIMTPVCTCMRRAVAFFGVLVRDQADSTAAA